MKTSHLLTVIIVALFTFMGMYVGATMNAIGETYQEGLDKFKFPFQIINLVTLIGCSVWLILAIASRKARVIGYKHLGSFSVGILLASALVFCLGFAPCLSPHPTTEPHHNHHNLKAVVERSLLCPRYSNRSYPGIFIYVLLGTAMFGVSRWRVQQDA